MESPGKSPRRFMVSQTVVVMLLLACTIPLNMGGCAAGNLAFSDLVDAKNKGVHAISLSDKDEDDLGQSVAISVTSRYGVYSDENLNHYVTLVGMTMAASSPRPDLRFYFCVLNSEDVNAFSGPNGYVMITHGAIKHMRDESELAGVLAHEIGHVVEKHGLKAVKAAELTDAGMSVLKAADRGEQMSHLSDMAVDAITNKGFGQPQEFDADEQGVTYLIAAGYDPNGFLRFLQRLQAEKAEGQQNLFATHPGLDERIIRIASQIAKSGKGGQGSSLKGRFQVNTGSATGVR